MARPLSRRDLLSRGALLALGGPALLAACSSGDKKDSGSSSDTAASGSSGSGGSDKKVRIATWPYYLEDDANPQASPTVKSFTKATGFGVDYKLAVDDNSSFTTKYQPDLEKGNGIGFDVVVLTSWMASRWVQRGWAQAFTADGIPNKGNILDRMANPSWDPDRAKTMPYAIGQVGIAYYPDKCGFEVKSIKDLLDPRLKDRVTILSEMRDTTGLFLLANGVEPEKATVDETLKAIDDIAKARSAGQFRKITGNSYIEDLGLGDIWACVAWSGDVASLQKENPDLKWVLPSDGAMSFVDTMLIPTGGNLTTGQAWINHLYDPTVSGPLFEAISYTSPVKGAGDHMSAAAAKNPLVNPAPDAPIHEFRDLTEAEANTLEEAFAKATQQ